MLNIKPNHKKRTFTIRKYYKDGTIVKYRTVQFSKSEFDNNLNNTENDWKYFMRMCDCDYYKV